jgi:hypothetical protein
MKKSAVTGVALLLAAAGTGTWSTSDAGRSGWCSDSALGRVENRDRPRANREADTVEAFYLANALHDHLAEPDTIAFLPPFAFEKATGDAVRVNALHGAARRTTSRRTSTPTTRPSGAPAGTAAAHGHAAVTAWRRRARARPVR